MKNNTSNMGQDIKELIQDALSSDNFKKLNENITKTVNQALEEARKNNWQKKKKSKLKNKPDLDDLPYTDYETVEINNSSQPIYSQKNSRKSNQKSNQKSNRQNYQPPKDQVLISKSPRGRISGILLMVFGNIGIGLTVLIILATTFFASLTTDVLAVIGYSSLVLLPLLLGFVAMVAKGASLRSRYKRFKAYLKEFNGQSFLTIDQLAKAVNRSRKFVIKDLRKMISAAMFPRGKLDSAETLIFLDDVSYQAHLDMLKGLRLQEEENEKQLQAMRQKGIRDPREKAVLEVITEGKLIIRQINEANAEIKGEVISKKLLRLEIVVTKIFQYIENNPDEVLEIRKFMDYYLPTTLKLVNTYRELERESFQGPTIRATKKEIEETLDTINQAFEKLLDGFYEDTALDVSSDISVLNTLLAQEGLTKRDFEQGEKNG